MASSIPVSKSTVGVSVISPNRVLGVPPSAFLTPDINGTTYSDTPCLCFLIEHTDAQGQTTRMLFDLGIRKDWESSPPPVVEAVRSMGVQIATPRDVSDILVDSGVDLATVNQIILSHWHFDHIGDPTRFPLTTDLVVGPGFHRHCLPGHPINADSMLSDEAFRHRKVKEITFDVPDLQISDLNAVDWFGDGSFYLLSTPGHAIGHLSALARTTAHGGGSGSTFVMLAGDVCHHSGELRPTELLPLPLEIPPNTKHRYQSQSTYCSMHPTRSLSEPFYCPSAGGFNLDARMMKHTLDKVAVLDAEPDVFIILAHDHWLMDIVELFPRVANDWKAKQWREKSKWRFLLDFAPSSSVSEGSLTGHSDGCDC